MLFTIIVQALTNKFFFKKNIIFISIYWKWPMRERKWPRNKLSTRESPMWTFRRRQRGRCAMPAPRPGAVTFLIVNASVAGKYALCIVFFILIYSYDKHKLHSRQMKRKQKKVWLIPSFLLMHLFRLFSNWVNLKDNCTEKLGISYNMVISYFHFDCLYFLTVINWCHLYHKYYFF